MYTDIPSINLRESEPKNVKHCQGDLDFFDWTELNWNILITVEHLPSKWKVVADQKYRMKMDSSEWKLLKKCSSFWKDLSQSNYSKNWPVCVTFIKPTEKLNFMAARPIQSRGSRSYATGLAGENPVCVTPIFFDKKNIKKGAKGSRRDFDHCINRVSIRIQNCYGYQDNYHFLFHGKMILWTNVIL